MQKLWSVGRDSVVGIATRYGLDGPGVESRWGRDFPHPSRPALGPTQPPTVGTESPGGKAAGAWRWSPTPILRRDERQSRAIPLLPFWAFMACSRVNVTFTSCEAPRDEVFIPTITCFCVTPSLFSFSVTTLGNCMGKNYVIFGGRYKYERWTKVIAVRCGCSHVDVKNGGSAFVFYLHVTRGEWLAPLPDRIVLESSI